MELKRAIVRSFDSGTYKATLEIAGSPSSYLTGVPVARDIASGEMTAGRSAAVLFLDASNPSDAVVLAVWA
jgi:hypothetical protein